MMPRKDVKILEAEIKRILPIFLDELGEYIPIEREEKLRYTLILRVPVLFSNGFGAHAGENRIFYATQNTDVFRKFSKREDFGKNPEAVLVTEEDFIDNDKDYLDYFQYFIDKGLIELDYSLDVLPHTAMHLLGSSHTVLGEGITELLTREICKKHGIRCAPIMHSKETKLIRMLEKYLHRVEILDTAFGDLDSIIVGKCVSIFGPEFGELYKELSREYRDYTNDRTKDPLEHYEKYREINFDSIFELIQSKEKKKKVRKKA